MRLAATVGHRCFPYSFRGWCSDVLVTGATGGVGRYAVQLAALAGAMVTALVRDVEKSSVALRQLGAEEVVDTVERDFDLVVDAVGGATFATAIEHLAPRGVMVNLVTGSPAEVVSFRAARFDRAPGATIHTFNLRDELDQPKTSLISSVELETPWQEVNRAIDALLRREIAGKAVLHVARKHTFRA